MYGSLSGKLVAETVAPLAPFVQQAILVQPDNPRAMPLAELKPRLLSPEHSLRHRRQRSGRAIRCPAFIVHRSSFIVAHRCRRLLLSRRRGPEGARATKGKSPLLVASGQPTVGREGDPERGR